MKHSLSQCFDIDDIVHNAQLIQFYFWPNIVKTGHKVYTSILERLFAIEITAKRDQPIHTQYSCQKSNQPQRWVMLESLI